MVAIYSEDYSENSNRERLLVIIIQDYVIKPVSLGKQTKDNGTRNLMASALPLEVLTLYPLLKLMRFLWWYYPLIYLDPMFLISIFPFLEPNTADW